MKKLKQIREKIALRAGLILVLALAAGRLCAQVSSAFSFSQARVRVITPNGDGKNDRAILCFDNPKASGVRGEIFSLTGRKVAEMDYRQNAGALGCPGSFAPEALVWDGRAFGSAVSGGVYVYMIRSEDKTVTGTVLVVR